MGGIIMAVGYEGDDSALFLITGQLIIGLIILKKGQYTN